MFLKSAPPAVAIHSDWRSVGTVVSAVGAGGAPQSLGLPLCFNDSDSSLSSSGAPIHQKVQMIIDSLRSTQSSVDMSDGGQMEGTTGSAAHCSREPLRQTGRKAAKAAPGPACSRVGAAVTDCPRPPLLNPTHTSPESQASDSDSDSSVDRGIEEAIQEYLKEKVDHKRKAEPASVSTSPVAKLPCRETVVKAEQPRLQSCSDNNKVLTASNHILKTSKGNINPAAILRKKFKKKRPSKENPVKKPAVTMVSFFKRLPPPDQREMPSTTLPQPDKVQPSQVVKVKDEPLDAGSSSSDDGIEEEIRRYQQQKNMELIKLSWHQQTRKEDSDSSSDDGIEEAIRRFQQEKKQKERVRQKKKKGTPKHLQLNNSTSGQDTVAQLNTDRTEVSPSGKKASKPEPTRKRKREKSSLGGKLAVPQFSSERPTSFSSPPCDSLNGKGHVIPACKMESTPVPVLKANTTAELMCAEAILDISKAVMPMAFDLSPQALGPVPLAPSTGPSLSKDPSNDESSVDSEDGIELEIRKFLEQKAQMKKQTPAVPSAAQKLGKTFQPIPPTELEKGDHSEDKSSSLDSDEDLDAAIKDLLKTKKKVKRKTKKLATKPTGNSPTITTTNPSKKLKVLPETSVKTAKSGLPKAIKKKTSQMKDKKVHKPGNGFQDKKQKKKTKAPGQQMKVQHDDKGESVIAGTCVPDPLPVKEEEEDSSSVDSDDSIEQEIRRFLAEKAKGGGGNVSMTTVSTSTTPVLVEKTEAMQTEITHPDQTRRNASPMSTSNVEDQQAEIPLDVGTPCLPAQHGVWQTQESGRESWDAVGNVSRDRLPHTPSTTWKGERKGSFEDRHPPSVDSLQREKPLPHFDRDTPSSRQHTFTHTPSRTHTSTRHSPNRTHTPNNPIEITPFQTTPCHVRTNSPTTPTPSPSVADSCGRGTESSLPAGTFYWSSAKTPVREGHQTPHVASDSLSQGSGKRARWDQPAPSQTPQRSGSTLHSSQQASHYRQEREGKEERARAAETELRKVKQEEEEFIDEADLDPEEERRQSKARQQRFPCV